MVTKKFLLKAQNKIHILSQSGELVYPNIEGFLNQADYENWGMDTLNGLENEISKVKYEIEQDGQLGQGYVARKIINKNEFNINSINAI